MIYYQLEKFWDEEYKSLNYIKEEFNDPFAVTDWIRQGYSAPFGGWMCDMRSPQPSWNNKFISHFADLGWQDIGTSYYRMESGSVLPTHRDLYIKYIELFNLQGQERSINRAIVFLEDWQSGHYAEYLTKPFISWSAGATVEWCYDETHMAANFGPTPRYTLQITGHK
jgi:hypothetical protein